MVIWHDPRTAPSLAGLTVSAEDISFTLDEITSATTLTVNHFLVIVNASGNTKVTLPIASSHAERIYTIKNIHRNGTVTIDAYLNETIDGALTIDLKLQYSFVTIVCDGDEWFIIGGMNVKLEDLMKDIKIILTDSKEVQGRTLFLVKRLEEYERDSSDLTPDQDGTEEELRELVVEVND